MIVTCTHCSAQFQVDDSHVKSTGTKVRCARCQELFTVHPEKKREDSKFDFSLDNRSATGKDETPQKPRTEEHKASPAQADEQNFSPTPERAIYSSMQSNIKFPIKSEDERNFSMEKDLEILFEDEAAATGPSLDTFEVNLDLDKEEKYKWMDFGLPGKEDQPAPAMPNSKVAAIQEEEKSPRPLSGFFAPSSAPNPKKNIASAASSEEAINNIRVRPSREGSPRAAQSQNMSSPTLGLPLDMLDADDKAPRSKKSTSSPTKTKSKDGTVMKSLFSALLFLLLALTIYCGLYYAQKNKLIDLPFELTMPVQLTELPVLNYLFPTQKVEDVPDAGNIHIRTFDIQLKFIANEKLGKILVLTGKARNTYTHPREQIRLRAKLFVGTDTVRTRMVYAGNILSDENLVKLAITEMETELNKPTGDDNSNANVQAGAEIPFMFVFADLPASLSGYEINVVSSQQAGQ